MHAYVIWNHSDCILYFAWNILEISHHATQYFLLKIAYFLITEGLTQDNECYFVWLKAELNNFKLRFAPKIKLTLPTVKIFFSELVHYYRTRMREGNVFILSACQSVRAITFECLDIETSFLVWWYIWTIHVFRSRSLDQGQGHW